MARTEVKNLTKRFGNREVVRSVSFSVEEGELVALLGPSGSGKTTVLRCIAGLERPDGGQVLIGGKECTEVPPRERDVSMVFQNYALFPLMTVRDNIAFPLRVRGTPSAEIDRRVKETGDRLGIGSLLDKLPSKLSGGEQQRVAIARAIIRPTNGFLMDEPLSNLDAPLRAQLRTELKGIQREMGITVVYVTHDQVEAMTLADKIVLLNEGEVLQFGPPMELYRRPSSPFAARFIGSPGANLMEAVITFEGGTLDVSGNGFTLSVPSRLKDSFSKLGGRRVVISIRPEDIRVTSGTGTEGFAGEVRLVEPLGPSTQLDIGAGATLVKALVGRDYDWTEGSRIWCTPDFDNMRVFDADSGEPVPLA